MRPNSGIYLLLWALSVIGLSACQQVPTSSAQSSVISGVPNPNLPSALTMISHGRYDKNSLSTPQISNASKVEWNPDGTKIAVCGSNLLVYGLNEASVIFETKDPRYDQITQGCARIKWSANGQKILLVYPYSQTQSETWVKYYGVIIDTTTWQYLDLPFEGRLTQTLPSSALIDMTSDGKTVIARYGNTIQIINTEQNTTNTIALPDSRYSDAVFSPDGQKIAFIKSKLDLYQPNKITVYTISTQQEESITELDDATLGMGQLAWFDNMNLSFIRYGKNIVDRFQILDTITKIITDDIPMRTISEGRYNICTALNTTKDRFIYSGIKETNFGTYEATVLLEKPQNDWSLVNVNPTREIVPFIPGQFEVTVDNFPIPDEVTYVRKPYCFGIYNEQKIAFSIPAQAKVDSENYDSRTALNVFNFDMNAVNDPNQTYSIPVEFNTSIFEGRFTHFANIYTSKWSPDGTKFLTGGRDGQIKLFDGKRQRLIKNWKTNNQNADPNWGSDSKSIYSLDWSPDSQMFASAYENGNIELWDTKTRTTRGKLEGHTSTVRSIAWNPAQPLLVSGSWDQTIRLWNTNSQTLEKTITTHTADVHAVAWNSIGTQFASASSDTTVKIWDAQGTEQHTLLGATAPLLIVAWSPDNTKIAAAGTDKKIFVWEASTGTLLHAIVGALGSIRTLDWLTNETIIAGGTDKLLRIFTLEPQLQPNGKTSQIRFERGLRPNTSQDIPPQNYPRPTPGDYLPIPALPYYVQENERDNYDHDIFTISLDPTRKKLVVGVKNGLTRIYAVR